MNLKMTNKAIDKAKSLKKSMQLPEDWVLMVGLTGGGCSGFKYEFDFVAPPENDELYRKSDYNGLEVYCDRKSYMFLSGTEIDYEETIMSSGFTFNSPYAQRACGCGESVSFDLNKDIKQ